MYKAALQTFFGGFLRHNRDVALLLAAVSLLPVLVLSIRWSASGLGANHAQADLASLLFRLAHAFLLLVCLCAVFDPPFSPRQISVRFGLLVTFLPLYYLVALSIGYYSGFLLLLYGPDAVQRLRRRDTLLRAAYRVVPKLVYVLCGLTVVGLLLQERSGDPCGWHAIPPPVCQVGRGVTAAGRSNRAEWRSRAPGAAPS